MDSIGWLRDSLRNQISDDAVTINAAVTLGEPIEENERTVNEVYLSTVARGIYEFTATQVELIYNIASQCPLSGGTSVFKARALYSLIDIKARFIDTELCNRVGIQYRIAKTDETTPAFKIYPNPADASITIACIGNINCKKTVEIFDVVGKRIYTDELGENIKEKKIDISKIMPGVYHIKIGCNEINFIDKIIKIH